MFFLCKCDNYFRDNLIIFIIQDLQKLFKKKYIDIYVQNLKILILTLKKKMKIFYSASSIYFYV